MRPSLIIRESSAPLRSNLPAMVNASDVLFERAERQPGRPVFVRKASEVWRPVSARRLAEQVTELAGGLIAAGIGPGDRVVLMSGTRFEWVLCDFAIWTAGAITVPIYETASAEQVSRILDDCAPAAVFIEDDRHQPLFDRVDVPVWTMAARGLDTLMESGKAVSASAVERRRRAVSANSPATIVYTSGTTGFPRGCLITHGNLVGVVRNTALADGVRESVLTEHTHLLLFLPLAHVFARMVQLVAVHNGTVTAHTSDIKGIATELRTVRPTLLLAVPRVFEKLYNTARREASKRGREQLFQAAERTAIDYSRALDEGGPSLWTRAKHWVFDRLVYSRIRQAIGGRVECAVSGGAPLNATLGHFFRGAGVTILEGYGLTETSAAVTLNLPGTQRIGTVGTPLPGVALRIADDGEVLVRGPGVFQGYWHDEQATRDAFDDGWLRTGDVGVLDGRHLIITGRKKDIIVTSSGKNVSPAFLEDRLRGHWLVDECVVVGDQRPYVAALVTVDPDAFEDWKRAHARPASATVAELREDAGLLAEIQTAVDEVNCLVSNAEAIKRIRIPPSGFTVGEALTPTQKVRRAYVMMRFADDVAALYSETPTPG